MISADILETLGATLPCPCAVFDRDGKVLWLNQAARDLEHQVWERIGPETAGAGFWTKVGAWLERQGDYLAGKDRRVRVPANVIGGERRGTGIIYLEIRQLQPPGQPGPLVVATCTVSDKALATSRAPVPVFSAGKCPSNEVLELLTPREREIALLAAHGYSCPNIAALLGVKESTVYSHLKHAYKKLGVHNRAQLAWLLRNTIALPP